MATQLKTRLTDTGISAGAKEAKREELEKRVKELRKKEAELLNAEFEVITGKATPVKPPIMFVDEEDFLIKRTY